MQIWQELERWYKANAAETYESLNPGCDEAELRETERHFNVTFPEDVRASYLLHDGQKLEGSSISGDGYQLMSMQEIRASSEFFKIATASGSGRKGAPNGPLKDDLCNVLWVPFMTPGNGNFRCMDFDPAPHGKPGQIIQYWNKDADRSVLAPSFTDWLEAILKSCLAGKFRHRGSGASDYFSALLKRPGG